MKTCKICKEQKELSSFEKWQHKCIDCKDLYKCSICKIVKSHFEFRRDSSRSTGLSSKCKKCANKRVKDENYYIRRRIIDTKRRTTPIRKARQFFKDCLKRLNAQKTESAWKFLGFTKKEFVSKFPTIDKGFHIDHCIPLSWFKDGTPISISCSLDNLQLLDSCTNIRKSNNYASQPSSIEYINKILPYIKEEFKNKYISLQGGWVG